MVLSERYREILKAVIQDYIRDAEPVGSRTVSRKHRFHLSPATIRNIMADLEDMGYLAQPHTSAGRIPTDRGYRLYVDSLMEPQRLSRADAQRIEQRVMDSRGELEELMRETSKLLSALTPYVGIVLAPRFAEHTFGRVEFVHLHGERILVVLVAESGLVSHKVVGIDEVLEQEELNRIARVLNDLLGGLTLRQVRSYLGTKMAEEKALYDRLLARALKLGAAALEAEPEGEVYVGGAANIVNQPEFADVEKMRAMFAAFEEQSKLVKILDACLTGDEFKIIIGSEGAVRELQGLSVIASPYRRGDQVLGAIGVLGPTRMHYARMVPLVEHTARLISRLLTESSS